MSDPRNSIQPYQSRIPAGAMMTPQGPAVIQVIDIPAGGGELGPVNGFKPHKASGANILSAVLRRWWLVALVTVVIGGAGLVAAGKFVQPQWEGRSRIAYYDPSEDHGHGPIRDIVTRAETLLTARDIPILAARTQELQNAFPAMLKNRDLNDPIVQADVIEKLKDIVDWDEGLRGSNVIDIVALRPTANEAKNVSIAFGRAFQTYCQNTAELKSNHMLNQLEAEVGKDRDDYLALSKAIAKIKSESNFEVAQKMNESALDQIRKLSEELATQEFNLRFAESTYKALQSDKTRGPADQLARETMIEQEKGKDTLLQGYTAQLLEYNSKYEELVASGMTPEHPAVKRAADQLERTKANVAKREVEISSIIAGRISHVQDLKGQVDIASAKAAIDKAKSLIEVNSAELNKASEEARRLNVAKLEIDELQRKMTMIDQHRTENEKLVSDIKSNEAMHPMQATFTIEDEGTLKLKDDKTMKVKAAGMVLGLFMGVLLALLVDKFDKRLRDPRDLEPMVGAPLLGTIPRIQELKRIKGEQARNLIAEEFRIIRTQVLFGNPNLAYKIIAITSPAPGDGKTSLAVNLAISIAKSGRRTLLIDGDLRKPDVHRVFNVPDSPGFAELIQGSHEPAAVIRKSEIDGLDILPAGTPIARPSELLSRPEMQALLATLGDRYDHIVMDTAPLLPVSDTHILVGMVDGVICSFNSEVDRDTVAMCQEILRRSRATMIGSVMNQVKYKQSGSYHRGKTSYESYYTSPRGSRQAAAAAKAEVATLPKAS